MLVGCPVGRSVFGFCRATGRLVGLFFGVRVRVRVAVRSVGWFGFCRTAGRLVGRLVGRFFSGVLCACCCPVGRLVFGFCRAAGRLVGPLLLRVCFCVLLCFLVYSSGFLVFFLAARRSALLFALLSIYVNKD